MRCLKVWGIATHLCLLAPDPVPIPIKFAGVASLPPSNWGCASCPGLTAIREWTGSRPGLPLGERRGLSLGLGLRSMTVVPASLPVVVAPFGV